MCPASRPPVLPSDWWGWPVCWFTWLFILSFKLVLESAAISAGWLRIGCMWSGRDQSLPGQRPEVCLVVGSRGKTTGRRREYPPPAGLEDKYRRGGGFRTARRDI